MKVKGIAILPNGKFRVQKYGAHIGVYNTIKEAEEAAIEADKFQKELKHEA